MRAAAWVLLVGLPAMAETPGELWWNHVKYLADDKLEGRAAGSAGHRAAAAYVAEQFEKIGLKPAGTDGWLQNIPFDTRQIVEAESGLALIRDGQRTTLTLGKEAFLGVGAEIAPQFRAPMVFVGYGLKVPEMNWDDLKGVDLKGKIAVFIGSAPKSWPAPLSAHMQSTRWTALQEAGAVGTATIPIPLTVPWPRASAARLLPSMVARLPETGKTAGGNGAKVAITINPDLADIFLEGSGHTMAELRPMVGGDAPLPKFPLKVEAESKVAIKTSTAESPNVIGLLEGRKKDEFVVVSAHLDHLGKTASFSGDGIFNGAMDNASGVAAVMETARVLKAGPPPERSVLFIALTGEEKGLQGSRYFARVPTVPRAGIVADLNMDMFMPIHALRGLIFLGGEESTLGEKAAWAAKEFNIPVLPDPMPEQRRFVRSDQYSFIKEGIPSLAFKFGYTKGSPEEALQADWLKTRYHAVSDDITQPVDAASAGRFTEFMAALVRKIANDSDRPVWKQESFFRRFAK